MVSQKPNGTKLFSPMRSDTFPGRRNPSVGAKHRQGEKGDAADGDDGGIRPGKTAHPQEAAYNHGAERNQPTTRVQRKPRGWRKSVMTRWRTPKADA